MKNAAERGKEKLVNEHRSNLITIYSTLVKCYISLLWCLIHKGRLFAAPSEAVGFGLVIQQLLLDPLLWTSAKRSPENFTSGFLH